MITYNYDELLRVTSVDEMIDGEMYSTSFTYDEVGRKLEETFPSGLTIKNVYSNSGYCRSIIDVDREKVIWTANKVDSFGNIVEFETANGCVSEFSYDDLNNSLLSILTKKVILNYRILYIHTMATAILPGVVNIPEQRFLRNLNMINMTDLRKYGAME